MNIQRFEVPYNNTVLVGDIVPAGQKPTVLMLHGAGTSHRGRHRQLQVALAAVGIASASFDQIGHGDTDGELKQSSLHDRTNQAIAVIEHLNIQEPFGLFGGSMGAYTELRLTEHYKVDKLVLTVPGVYAADAYDLPFGAGFTERIRRPESWRETDAWSIINHFTGDLLVVTAEHDEVVPAEIPARLYDAATSAHSRSRYEIKGSQHRYWDYLNQPKNATLLKDYLTRLQRFFAEYTPNDLSSDSTRPCAWRTSFQ